MDGASWTEVAEKYGYANNRSARMTVLGAAADDEERQALVIAHKRPAKKRRRYDRGYRLRMKYGITLEQYAAMLREQGGVCAICGLSAEKEALAVDHDHATGIVRGLLCRACNTAIGHMADDPQRLHRAIDYLVGQTSLKVAA